MDFTGIQVWGDSILKGVIYNAERGRYSILKENAVSLISERLHASIVNKSRMGRTAPEALNAMHDDQADMNGAAVVIELGGNDCDYNWEEIANEPRVEHQCHTPAEIFTSSLEKIISLIRSRNGIPIVCTLPPLNAGKYFDWITRNGLSRENILEYIGQPDRIYRWQEYYSLLALRVADELRCKSLPIRESILVRLKGEDIWCADGIHLNDVGHIMMADAVVSAASV